MKHLIRTAAFSMVLLVTACGGNVDPSTMGTETTQLKALQTTSGVVQDSKTLQSSSAPSLALAAAAVPMELADYNMIVIHGQSNGQGAQAPRLTKTEYVPDRAYRFYRGIHTWASTDNAATPENRPSSQFQLVPLSSPYAMMTSLGNAETVAHGLAANLTAQTASGHKFIFSYAGQGGRFLRELDKRHDDAKDPRAGTSQTPGGYYRTAIDDIKRAKALADAEGKTFKVLGVLWMQGESEGGYAVNRWDGGLPRPVLLQTYQSDLLAVKSDFIADARLITGQAQGPYFLSYQTVGSIAGQAQLNASLFDTDLHMTSSSYMFEKADSAATINTVTGVHTYGSAIHWSSDGQRWMGAQMAKKLLDLISGDTTRSGLYPVRFVRSDRLIPGKTVIDVTYNVPKPPLVLDTNSLPLNFGPYGRNQNRAGFKVANSSSVVGLESVQVTGPDSIRVITESRVPADQDFRLMYAGSAGSAYFSSRLDNAQILSYRSYTQGGGPWTEVSVAGSSPVLPATSYLHTYYCDVDTSTLKIMETAYDTATNVTYLRGPNSLATRTPPSAALVGKRIAAGSGCRFAVAYGNVRDSETRQSVMTFSTGNNAGSPMPLNNWSLSFEQPLDTAVTMDSVTDDNTVTAAERAANVTLTGQITPAPTPEEGAKVILTLKKYSRLANLDVDGKWRYTVSPADWAALGTGTMYFKVAVSTSAGASTAYQTVTVVP